MSKAILTANPGESIYTITRSFNAPRDKVYAALTQKDKIAKWFSAGKALDIEEYDPREGGRWKFVQSEGGQKNAFFGVFHEVSPERVIQTFEFDGLGERGHVIMERMELRETEAGTTELTVVDTFFSVADRDGMIQSGMEEGMNASYDSLDKVLAEM